MSVAVFAWARRERLESCRYDLPVGLDTSAFHRVIRIVVEPRVHIGANRDTAQRTSAAYGPMPVP